MLTILNRQRLVLTRFRALCSAILFGISGLEAAPLQAIDPQSCRVCASPVDWTTLPSTYTHDREGRRVDQFALGIEPVSNERPDFQQSGFRHTRSSLQAGTSSDNFHVVERWGAPVQPYGEWRYPYRPYSVPYGAWGPQSPLVNVQGNGWGGYPGFPGRAGFYGHPGQPMNPGILGNPPAPNVPPNSWFPQPAHGGFPGGFPDGAPGFGVGPNNALRPDQDDYYAPAPEPPPVSDRDFFYVPRHN